MLYWICPECGHECSPAIRECPTCTAPPVQANGNGKPTAVNQELLSLAQQFESAPASAKLTPVAQRQAVLSANGHETSAKTAVAIEEEPPAAKKLAALGAVRLEPSRPGVLRSVNLNPTPAGVRIAPPAVPFQVAPTPSTYGLAEAGAKPAGEIVFQPAEDGPCAEIHDAAEPLPSRRRSVAFVRAGLPGADCSRMAMAGLQELQTAPPHPNGGLSVLTSAPQLGQKSRAPRYVSSGVDPAGESVGAVLSALLISAEEKERRGIQAIQNSFSASPTAVLLSAPAEIVAAPAPVVEKWMRSEKTKFTAVAPENMGTSAVIAGPRTPTLAGPSLPAQLLNFGQQPSSLRSHRRRLSMWPILLAVVAVLIVGVVGIFQYLTRDGDGRAASLAPLVQFAKSAPPQRFGVAEEHPAARSVEVAGIRILTAPNRKPQLEFIVINHSAKEITGLNIRIAVGSVDAPTDAPLFSASSAIPVLGPNQSKEVRAEVNGTIEASDIPDWQSLRTQVLIGHQ